MAKKDPNAPKGALSAYMFFATDKRPGVVKSNPTVSFGEVGKIMGDMWKKASEAEKKPYIAKAEADKARYTKEKAAYDKKA